MRGALAFALTVFGSANGIIYGVFPLAGRAIGLAEWQVGLIFTISAAGQMLTAPHWGRYSDRHGRRRVIVLGLSAFAIGSILFGLTMDLGLGHVVAATTAWIGFIVIRLSMASVLGGMFPAAQAFIADRAPPQTRAVALSGIIAAFALGNVLGPAGAAMLTPFGLAVPIYVSACIGAVAAVTVWRLLPAEKSRIHVDRPALRLGDARVRLWIAVGFGYFVCVGGGLQILGFVIQDQLHLDLLGGAKYTSLLLMLTGAVAVFFQVVVLRRLRPGARAMLALGLVSATIVYATFGFCTEIWQVMVLSIPFGTAFACVQPGFSASASLAVRGDEQGAVAGLIASAQACGFLVGPILFGGLYQLEPLAPLLVAACICATLVVLAQANSAARRGTLNPAE